MGQEGAIGQTLHNVRDSTTKIDSPAPDETHKDEEGGGKVLLRAVR